MPDRGRYIGQEKIPEKDRVTTHSSHDFVASFDYFFYLENRAGKLSILNTTSNYARAGPV